MDETGTDEENIILVTTPNLWTTAEETKKLQLQREVFLSPWTVFRNLRPRINFLLEAFPQEFSFTSFSSCLATHDFLTYEDIKPGKYECLVIVSKVMSAKVDLAALNKVQDVKIRYL